MAITQSRETVFVFVMVEAREKLRLSHCSSALAVPFPTACIWGGRCPPWPLLDPSQLPHGTAS